MANDEPITVDDIEILSNLTGFADLYINTGAYKETTLKENYAAFRRLKIRPRVLQGSRHADTKTRLFGEEIAIPICISPTGFNSLANNQGELAMAKAAGNYRTCICLSHMANYSLKEVRTASPHGLLWMQIQLFTKEHKSIKRIRQAEELKYQAIVLTVDSPKTGQRNKFLKSKVPPPKDWKEPGFFDDYVPPVGKDVNHRNEFIENELLPMTWESVDWLRSKTKLPIILKGILTREDAEEALKHDIQGIIVSNHGGRQLDEVPASIEALPEVVKEVNGRVDVFLDGGVRSGLDVFKALALGAKAVFIGRPAVWGLAYKGQAGVEKVFEILKNEFEETMVLAGCLKIEDIKPSMVVHESFYHKL